jgi:hypothetical protein
VIQCVCTAGRLPQVGRGNDLYGKAAGRTGPPAAAAAKVNCSNFLIHVVLIDGQMKLDRASSAAAIRLDLTAFTIASAPFVA